MVAGAQADADVDAVAREVGVADAGGDARLDVGVAGEEAVEPRHQPFGGEPRRGAYHQNAVLLAAVEPVDGLADGLEAGADTGVDEARRFRQIDGARTAMKQLQPPDVIKPA